jgi:hypothetical protein
MKVALLSDLLDLEVIRQITPYCRAIHPNRVLWSLNLHELRIIGLRLLPDGAVKENINLASYAIERLTALAREKNLSIF